MLFKIHLHSMMSTKVKNTMVAVELKYRADPK